MEDTATLSIILQKSLPWYRRVRLYGALYNARAAARNIGTAEALDKDKAVKEFTGDLKDQIAAAQGRLKDLPDLDPKDFSADQRDLIKQMLSTFDSLKQDPNLPQDVK